MGYAVLPTLEHHYTPPNTIAVSWNVMAEVLEVVLSPPPQYLSLAYSWHVHRWRVEVGVYIVHIQWLSWSGTGGGADPTITVPEPYIVALLS